MDIYLCVTGNASSVPSGEVPHWLGVHVGLLGGGVDAPHVDHVGDLAHTQGKTGAAHNITETSVLSGQTLHEPRDLRG